MSTKNPILVTRVYRVTLMPDPHTSYEPIFVALTYSGRHSGGLPPRSSRATSQAFRAAVEIERSAHHTPAHRRFLCGGSEFVAEWTHSDWPEGQVARVRHNASHATPRMCRSYAADA